jgi:hypothetical protein
MMPQSRDVAAQVPTDKIAALNVDLTESAVETKTAAMWAADIRRDLEVGTASYISAARKFLKAKEDLKRTGESFTALVDDLGENLDTVERWMAIARHPVLSDSATSRSLPTAWTTLYVLSRISPELLSQYIADGTVHLGLTYRAALQLKYGSRDRGADADGGDDLDGRGGHDRDQAGGDPDGDQHRGDPGDAIGPDSQGEIGRKLARLEELERESRRQAIQLTAYENEVAELKAKLGPETPIRPAGADIDPNSMLREVSNENFFSELMRRVSTGVWKKHLTALRAIRHALDSERVAVAVLLSGDTFEAIRASARRPPRAA